MPAAAPQATSKRNCCVENCRQRPTSDASNAASCTIGPSRPIEPPVAMVNNAEVLRQSVLAGVTTTVVALIGYSAMAGLIGGGGLGRLAYNYGYQRFQPEVMVVVLVILVLLVQLVQAVGDLLIRRLDHR